MIERGQPWAVYDVSGRVVRLQYLDPVTAFEVEPEIVRRLGPVTALIMADPGRILDALTRGSTLSTPSDVVRMFSARLSAIGDALAALGADPGWLASLFGRILFGRLTIDGSPVRRFSDLDRLGVTPPMRWQLLSLVMAQTFRPLWSRTPYDPRAPRGHDHGVPVPDVPIAARWAAELAKQGYASSMREILDTWTADQLLTAVDAAAHAAETTRRAHEAASKPSKPR